ncbi:MAG: hypothetical protein GY804_12965 [Alphaproteobacteria bacterium]|nr:hypothetical protein [Alphaproteobacteria bacterium]
MHKVTSEEKYEALQEKVEGILNGDSAEKVEGLSKIIDGLQDEAIDSIKKVAGQEQNGTPTMEDAEKNESIVGRLNLVAKAAIDNNLSQVLPCKKGHAGTKDEFYTRPSDVLNQSSGKLEKLPAEGSNQYMALSKGNSEAEEASKPIKRHAGKVVSVGGKVPEEIAIGIGHGNGGR